MNLSKQKIKDRGQIYTPVYIVNNILDLTEYFGESVLEKHVIDNSCGDGAFLSEIVKRYISAFINKYGKSAKLKKHLETYIHGIEIQKEEFDKCLINLNLIAESFNLNSVNWDIINADTLFVDKYNNKMDFVVGNPPYVRVHNLKNSYNDVKNFLFCKNGMTDLYIVFFEIGFRMLNSKGKMGLITPSSYLQSNAGAELRKYIFDNRNLSKVLDLEHFQAFNATTYTIISIFDKSKDVKKIDYFNLNLSTLTPNKIDELGYEDIFINNKFYLANSEDLFFLKKIEIPDSNAKLGIEVKNGFATLSDGIFIGQHNFHKNVIRILKASTGKWSNCIFPYSKDGVPLSISELKCNTELYSFLLSKKTKLENRSIDKGSTWFAFGRSQGVKDVFKNKIAINSFIKDIGSIKIHNSPAGTGVYSGLYILTDINFEKINSTLKSLDFLRYIKILKKYKSGGYYTFSSGELKKFLNYKLTK